MMQLKINSESELYNQFDPTQTRINTDVYNYLKQYCTENESRNHIHDTLQVITKEPIDEDMFRTALQNAVTKDMDEFDYQIASNNKRALLYYITGFALSVAGIALSIVADQILLGLISFLGTMAIRDAFMISLKINPDIKRLKKLLDPFTDFKLEVIVK